jgi:hypothetical protein
MATLTTENQSLAQDPYNQAVANVESNNNYSAQNPLSSAAGKYQFIQPTFEGVQRNNPNLPKITFDEFKKDPNAQEQYQQALRAENERTLRQNNIPVNPLNGYLMHFAGASKGEALIKAKDDQPLENFFPESTLNKNRLSPTMTVGQFKGNLNDKLKLKLTDKFKSNPDEQKRLGMIYDQQFSQGNTALSNGPTTNEQQLTPDLASNPPVMAPNPITPEVSKTLDELESLTTNVNKHQQGTPQYNLAAADALSQQKDQFKRNAMLAMLFGDRDLAMTYMTGGLPSKPTVAEASIDGKPPQQIWVNSNARGDRWYTDLNGNKLPNNILVTAQAPETAIGVGQFKQAQEINPQANKYFSLADTQKLKEEQGYIVDRSKQMPEEQKLIQKIDYGTQKFSGAMDHLLKSPQASAILKGLSSIKGGIVDEQKLQEAVTLSNVPAPLRGEFSQYLRDLANINGLDKNSASGNAPGAGAHGPVTLEAGSYGVNNWLARRSSSYAMQEAYNNYFTQYSKDKTVPEIIKGFKSSEMYDAVQNYQRLLEAKYNKTKFKLVDGAPVVDYDRNGRMKLLHYNAEKGRAE